MAPGVLLALDGDSGNGPEVASVKFRKDLSNTVKICQIPGILLARDGDSGDGPEVRHGMKEVLFCRRGGETAHPQHPALHLY